ncbi:MAG: hypothetical protein HZA54_01370 [Planctomycetes bacterium]|nr:hypothetical protein [Planctomycetota bacterium]
MLPSQASPRRPAGPVARVQALALFAVALGLLTTPMHLALDPHQGLGHTPAPSRGAALPLSPLALADAHDPGHGSSHDAADHLSDITAAGCRSALAFDLCAPPHPMPAPAPARSALPIGAAGAPPPHAPPACSPDSPRAPPGR